MPASFPTGLVRADLDPQRPRFVETPWGAMALYLDGGDLICAQAFCPHLEGPLFEGSVGSGAVTCPWHCWRYDLRSGVRLGPFGVPLPGFEKLKRCAVSTDAQGRIVLAEPTP